MNVINEFGFRQDARTPKQIRNITYQMGVYPQAEGSAYLEQGETKVLCAVYGPRECRFRSRAKEDEGIVVCQYSQTTFSVPDRRNRPRGDRRGNAYSHLLERAFESVILKLYPRSQIDIFFEVLEADGANLASCVNVASLALADAGIPIRGLVAATECGSADGTPCADLSSREHSELVPRLTMATVSGTDEIILIDMKNLLHKQHLPSLLQTGVKACAQVHSCLQTAVYKHVQATHKEPLEGNANAHQQNQAVPNSVVDMEEGSK